jgi:hypothetical protein
MIPPMARAHRTFHCLSVSALLCAALICVGLVFDRTAFFASEAHAATRAATNLEKSSAVNPSAEDSGAVLSFRKVFKSSTPEYTEIRVRQSGPCTYDLRSLADAADPQPLEVSTTLREKMFALAAQLQNFRGADLDIKRRIANLGEKTFRYERGSEVYEAHFNYTMNTAANQLLHIFEGLARQQDLMNTLTRRMKYDRLGVNDALTQLDSDFQRKLLPEPEAMLPALERIANDTRFVDIARQRARALVEAIRHPKHP